MNVRTSLIWRSVSKLLCTVAVRLQNKCASNLEHLQHFDTNGIIVIVCMMDTHSVTFVSYHLIFKHKLLWTHGAHTINPFFHIHFCEHDTRTILPASVGLAQAHPNNICMYIGSYVCVYACIHAWKFCIQKLIIPLKQLLLYLQGTMDQKSSCDKT